MIRGASVPITVSDHAVLRYLERVVGIDIEALRAEIAASCGRSAGAPCVSVGHARYLVRGRVIVTVLDGNVVPHWRVLADLARANAEGREP
jgi:hypothetical protein